MINLNLVQSIKHRIKLAQYRATIGVNHEMISLYHAIGSEINDHKTWGNKFIDNLIRIEYPKATGYSVRNLKYMSKFAGLFTAEEIVQEALAQITWYNHIALMEKGDVSLVRTQSRREWMVKKYPRSSD